LPPGPPKPMHSAASCPTRPSRLLLVAALCFAPAVFAQSPAAIRSELAGTSNKGRAFESMSSERLIGFAIKTGGSHKLFGVPVRTNTGDNPTGADHVMAVAPICASAAGDRLPLDWHGGNGSAAEVLLAPNERVLAVSGTFGGKIGESLFSLQFHMDARWSDLYGVAAVATDENPTNGLFLFKSPHGMIPIGVYGKADDQVHQFGIVFGADPSAGSVAAEQAGSPTPIGGATPLALTDVQNAVQRGHGARHDEGGSARNSIFRMGTPGYSTTLEGPLNQIANASREHASQKRPFSADSVSLAEPQMLRVTAKPWDPNGYRVGTLRGNVSTPQPRNILLVVKHDSSEHVIQPVSTELTYFIVTNDDDPSLGEGNPYVVPGLVARFAYADMPTSDFEVRIVTGLGNFHIQADKKARDRVH
jgi:hypothetical protein